MTSTELFNDLHGKQVSRNDLQEILEQAKTENAVAVVYRISKILNDNPQVSYFEMNIIQYPASQGLAGAQHTGDYREALDDCGRLRKGWKFVKGNVVKVEKPAPKEKKTPKNVGKGHVPSKEKAGKPLPQTDHWRKNLKEASQKFLQEKQESLEKEQKAIEKEKALWEKISKKDKEEIKYLEGEIQSEEGLMSALSRYRRALEEWSKNKSDLSPFNRYKIYGADAESIRRQYERRGIASFRAEYGAAQKRIKKYTKQIEKIKQKYAEAEKTCKTCDTNQNSAIFPSDKTGLGLPLTDEVRQKAFTNNGKLRKGWYYEENGILTDGKEFYISTNDFKSMTVSELRKFTLEYYNTHLKGKKTTIKNHLKEVVFVSSAGRKLMQPIYKEKVAVIEHLEQLIKNSTYNNWGNRKKTDSPDVLGYLNFKSKITIDGEKRHVRISVILDDKRKTRFKSFDVGANPKQKKESDTRRVHSGNPKDGQVSLSRSKHTKKSSTHKKNDKNFGLTAPVSVMQPTEPEAKPSVFVEYPHPLSPSPKEMGNTQAQQVDDQPSKQAPSPSESCERKRGSDRVRTNSLAQQIANQPVDFQSYQIDRYDMAQFLGEMEMKNVDSLVITLTGGQGSGKTRFAFQFMNDLAQRYKVGHISCEEHPQSRLYVEKTHQYLNATAMNNIEAHDVRSLSQLDKIIRENEVIVIDSYQKIKEIDSKFEVDKDLRKKYNGKLFLVIFQQTSDGKMRGGSKSQFDGDIILFTEKFPNYQENYVYPDKNRYNSIPANELKYNIFQQALMPVETEEQRIENQTYNVIY